MRRTKWLIFRGYLQSDISMSSQCRVFYVRKMPCLKRSVAHPESMDHGHASVWTGELKVGPAIEKFFAGLTAPRMVSAPCACVANSAVQARAKFVRTIIGLWAPSSEDDTAAYTRSVEVKMRKNKYGAEVGLGQIAAIEAFTIVIIAHENAKHAYPEPEDTLVEGIWWALL